LAAQLQRAVTSRAQVNLPEQRWRELDRAMESPAEGYFEIAWQGAIFTFWSNEAGPEPVLMLDQNGDPVYWHYGHEALDNRHLLVFGASGSGKTSGIQCLLSEMAVQGLRSLIIDYTDGFLPGQVESRFTEVAKPSSHYVASAGLPLNPFWRQQQIIDPNAPPLEENPYQVGSRGASIFNSVYESMGDQQFSTPVRAIENGISADSGFSLDQLLERLQDEGQYGLSLANKLDFFIKAQRFREGEESGWDAMLAADDQWVRVLQLKGFGRKVPARLIGYGVEG
jgi:DNA phosphorothioation-dependent restriction protein DptH